MKRICLLLALLLSVPFALAAATAKEYDNMYSSAAAKAGATEAQWADANAAAVAAVRAEMPRLAADAAGFPAILDAVKPDYGTAPIAAVRAAELSRYVTSPMGLGARRAWADALLAKAQATGGTGARWYCLGLNGKPATAPEVACFCLDQLRWCGYPEQAGAIAAFGNSPDKSVADLAPIVALAVKIAPPAVTLMEDGFVSLFNGVDLSGWERGVDKSTVKPGGILSCSSQLRTVRDYTNFVLRFEVRIPRNGNNGIGIRCPVEGDSAYVGMCELQVLDNEGPDYKTLQPYQYHGSVYGIVPAIRGHQKPAGEWNFEEIRVVGSRITVLLNGFVITDVDTATIKEPFMDHKAHPGFRNKFGRIGLLGHFPEAVDYRNIRVKEVAADWQPANVAACPRGFTRLYDGKDLTGWKGVTTEGGFDNPVVRQAATPAKRAEMQAKADNLLTHWIPRDGGTLFFDGLKGGYSLATVKDYKDFEMLVDWRLLSVRGDSGFYLRGSPQVQIWDAHNQWHIGSGGLYNNQKGPSKATCIADRLVGEWNTFRIRMVGEKVSVWLNGVQVVDNVTLENYWDRSKPIFPVEQLELQCHGDPLEFRNIFIREL